MSALCGDLDGDYRDIIVNIQDLLGIQLPIIQAPMAGAQGSALAIAVAQAGGLGSLPCGMLGPEEMLAEIDRIRRATELPYNLNFFCHTPPGAQVEAEARWRSALGPYYEEFGLSAEGHERAPQRVPFTEEIADLLAAIKPPVISFHFGLPSESLVQRVKSWGSVILGCATTIEEARWLEQRGADAIIAQGTEAGGHRGHFLSMDLAIQKDTRALVGELLEWVSLPVIAAGGIATANDVLEYSQLGAAGVQVGTAFLLCPEATTRSVHRAALSSPAAKETEVTNVFSGRAARGIMNRLMQEQGPISEMAPPFPLASDALAPLRAAAEDRGSGDFSPLWAGTRAAACRAAPAAEITRDLTSLL
ncbi:MAG: nitronate monooxygenase [Pseudomonadota bacterium]